MALILWIGTAQAADKPTNQSPYKVNVGRDLAIAALVGLVSGVPRTQANELLEPWCGLDCDPDDVGVIDRWAIDNLSKDAGVVSDFTYVGSMVFPMFSGRSTSAHLGPRTAGRATEPTLWCCYKRCRSRSDSATQ